MRLLLLTLMIALIAAACASRLALPPEAASNALDLGDIAATNTNSPLPANWQQQGVFMQIHVRTYADSNGDGFGDFRGLQEKLDYLQWLGVKGIWLLPITKSQDHDHGYAVTDYRSVEPDYGTLEDFKALVDAAHQRGIGIIIDYVLNHSAAQNPLFIDANAGIKPLRDWYIWQRKQPYWPHWDGVNTWHPGRDGYYYGVFWDQMPDFNLNNQQVINYHASSLRYWLNLGVDGFRLDAVGLLVEHGADKMFNQPENKTIVNALRRQLAVYDHRYIVCEAPDTPIEAGADDYCGSAFYFKLNGNMLGSALRGKISTNLAERLADPLTNRMATFLTNHDSFAGNRLAHQFKDNEGGYRMAAASLLLSPGIPFIYYGDEIGLGHSLPVKFRDDELRAPMSWTSDPTTAGFTSGKPLRPTADNIATYNVAAEQDDPSSLLNFYRTLIALRNQHPALHSGATTPLDTGNEGVLALRRSNGSEKLLILFNYASSEQTVSLAVADSSAPLWQSAPYQQKATANATTFTLAPQSVAILSE